MYDPLGNHLKSSYEDVYRTHIPRRTYAIVRIDGKAFHTFTKGLEKPYCQPLADSLDEATVALASQMMGTKFAYSQSDEISFLLTDFDKENTEAWFSGNIQKIASVSASIFTAHFNRAWGNRVEDAQLATFDSRVFVIPTAQEVANYFVWRQQDSIRNSLNSLASVHFSHKSLQGTNSLDKRSMLNDIGFDWTTIPNEFRRGRVIRKVGQRRTVSYTHKKTGQTISQEIDDTLWSVDRDIPAFEGSDYLYSLIPEHA